MPSWSGLFDGVHGLAYALLNEQNSTERGIARLMAPQAQLAAGAIDVALTGAAIGASATTTFKQVTSVQANGSNLGGLMSISTITPINRVTVAGDETRFDSMLQPRFAPTSYPVERSGNGGGGKLGTL